MDETKVTDNLDVKEETASPAPEEVIEVVLAEEDAEPAKSDEGMEYTEAELSGLTDAQRKRRYIMDKITTGILILLLISPIAILSYIFLWFIFR